MTDQERAQRIASLNSAVVKNKELRTLFGIKLFAIIEYEGYNGTDPEDKFYFSLYYVNDQLTSVTDFDRALEQEESVYLIKPQKP